MMENKCVVCGRVLPEGYGHVCGDCEKDPNNKYVFCDKFNLNIKFSFSKNPCLHIKDSYMIKSDADIKGALEYIHNLDEYKQLQAVGYTRTMKSEFAEWKAHNRLYQFGVLRARTGSVDIDQNESRLRRFGYVILSMF